MFGRIRRAYRLGMEKAVVAENLFWIHPHLIQAHAQYASQKEEWERRNNEIDAVAKTFGLVERIAYGIGDDDNSTDIRNLPLTVPRAA